VSILCGTFNRVCTENGCFGAEQPSESIYFVPANDRHMKMIAYGNYGMMALDGQHRRMILGAPLAAAPPEYAIKSSSIMFTSDGMPYSPKRECRVREADSQVRDFVFIDYEILSYSKLRDPEAHETPPHSIKRPDENGV
jgi:hypothetical protein